MKDVVPYGGTVKDDDTNSHPSRTSEVVLQLPLQTKKRVSHSR